MYSSNELIELVGKPETNNDVRKLLIALGHPKPPKRPKRGEEDTYVEASEIGVDLLFQLAETLSNEVASKLQEGELVLRVIFFSPVEGGGSAIYKDLPHNLQFSTTRKNARKLLGKPDWSGTGINNDRWVFGNIRLLVSFSDDESSIEKLSVGLVD